MPTFNDGEDLDLVRTKLNAVLGACELVLDPATLVADTALTYTAGQARTVAAGSKILTFIGGHRYEVVASGATTFDLQTAGGVKVLLLPDGAGWYQFDGMAPFKDGTTDNLAKLQKLLDNKSVTIAVGDWLGPSIEFSVGQFYFSNTINPKSRVRFHGQGTGFANVRGTDFLFPAATAGIVINRHNTLGAADVGADSGAADGSEIVGIRLIGGRGSAFDETKSGIWQRARGLVHNCAVVSFAGHGIYSAAGSDGNPYLGNVNLTRINQVFIQFCRGSGVYFDGTDANAGSCFHVDAKNNDGWAVYEASFLGNYHYGHHSESNTLGCYGASNQSAFVGCYAEDGVGGASNFAGIGLGNTITVNNGIGPVLNTEFANGPIAMANRTGGFRGSSGTHTTDIASEDDAILSSRWGPNESYPFRIMWDNTGAGAYIRFASSSNILIRLGGASSGDTYGRSSAVGEHVNMPSLFLGVFGAARALRMEPSIPTSGNVARGEVIFLNAPSAGGAAMAHCTTGGVAGSTAVFKNAANIQA